jgi:glycerol-3-phosphate dehydrogenase subunit C
MYGNSYIIHLRMSLAAWPIFARRARLFQEARRVFDVCHGCRRCFNLCNAFPKLFDLVDAAKSGELSGVGTDEFKGVSDLCTLCDLCYNTKCPYTPPHPLNIDFPKLILRYRAAENKAVNMVCYILLQTTLKMTHQHI